MRLSSYHKSLGDSVTFSKGKKPSVPANTDKIYISCIYKKNKKHVDTLIDSLANEYTDNPPEIDAGGSGYDITKVLPLDVEACSPDYSIYPENDSSYGFSSRGCVRRCGFCIVKDKEGSYRRTDHPEKWHNPSFSQITFLDNNILSDPEYFFELTDWCLSKGLTIRFLSGYDIRLLTPEIAARLHKIRKHHTLSFAWDNIGDEAIIREKIELLRSSGFSHSDLRAYVQLYVYVDNDSDEEYESGVYRCRELKKLNCNTFVMYNTDNKKSKRIAGLQRWANRKHIFWDIDIDDYRKRNNADVTGDLDDWL
jgi:hypothetical protein